jgi:hypothetical protein
MLLSVAPTAATCVALLVAGCKDAPVMPTDDQELQLSIVSGDNQTETCFEELPEPVVVKVTREGTPAPLPNQLVNFRVAEGGGWVWGGSALTNGSGMAAD